MQNKRLDYIDIAKGIGMLTIIWGHIMEKGPVNTFVYSFHIPLFFFLSGMVFRSEKYTSIKEFAAKKFRTILIPYFVFSFLTWLVWVLYNAVLHNSVDSYFMPLVQTMIAQGSGGYLIHNVPLWYVPCLLAVELIYFCISRSGKESTVFLLSGAFAVSSYLMERYVTVFDYTELPWSLGAAFAGILFYAAGNHAMRSGLIHKMKEQIDRKPLCFLILLIFMTGLLMVLSAVNGHVSMGHEQYGKYRTLFYLNGFLGTFCVLIFSMMIENFRQAAFIRWIGLYSLYWMFIENPVKGFIVVIVSKMMHISEDILSASIVPSLIAFVISTAVTAAAVRMILIAEKKFRKNQLLIG